MQLEQLGQLARVTAHAESYLRTLCSTIPNRSTGSTGNKQATAFFAERLAAADFAVEAPTFPCIDWQDGAVTLTAGGKTFPAFASPYSPGVRATGPLTVIRTVEELAAAVTSLSGRIVLLCSPIAAAQLMPKNFPFYNPDEHKQIISLLEAGAPLALITATARDPQMAGALYPFPMFEDGDFDIPSVYMTDEMGGQLAACAQQPVTLVSQAKRIPSTACNVIGRKRGSDPDAAGKIVCCAHIDAKRTTPGAIDNASGTVIMLLLAELLADYPNTPTLRPDLEIVAINGEDYYSSPGEMQYLTQLGDEMARVKLGINVDGAGYRVGRVAYSLYNCPERIAETVRVTFAADPGIFTEGEPWYQGDHMMFLMSERPALAVTSENVAELMARYVHTADDTPALVDPTRLARTALALHEIVLRVGGA